MKYDRQDRRKPPVEQAEHLVTEPVQVQPRKSFRKIATSTANPRTNQIHPLGQQPSDQHGRDINCGYER
ncbi:hypothetical protein [Nocardia sp. NPDC004750]